MLQSSSPSYLLMASLDDARAYAESYTEEDRISFLEKRDDIFKKFHQITSMKTIETDDPLKLLSGLMGTRDYDIQRALDQAGVYAELADCIRCYWFSHF